MAILLSCPLVLSTITLAAQTVRDIPDSAIAHLITESVYGCTPKSFSTRNIISLNLAVSNACCNT